MKATQILAALVLVSVAALGACAGDPPAPEPLPGEDAGGEAPDAAEPIEPVVDAGVVADAGAPVDAGQPKVDAGQPDAGPPVDTKFTLAVLPDTQRELNSAAKRPRFTHRAQWMVDNKAALDLRFVMQVGDLVDWDTPDHVMYAAASTDLRLLENAQLPYAIAVGNHDTAAVGVGGSACCPTGTEVHAGLRNTATFNAYFPASRFKALGGTFETGKVDNAFHTFSAGGLDWLVLNIELWARPAAVAWAKTVLAAHPKHNVIIITHSHLTAGSGIEPTNGGYGDSTAQSVYDNLIKQYANVRFVFSGHVGTSGYRQDTGVNGNTIYSFLQCYHDETSNPLRLVELDTAAGTLSTRVYAPFTNETKADGTYTVTGIRFVR